MPVLHKLKVGDRLTEGGAYNVKQRVEVLEQVPFEAVTEKQFEPLGLTKMEVPLDVPKLPMVVKELAPDRLIVKVVPRQPAPLFGEMLIDAEAALLNAPLAEAVPTIVLPLPMALQNTVYGPVQER